MMGLCENLGYSLTLPRATYHSLRVSISFPETGAMTIISTMICLELQNNQKQSIPSCKRNLSPFLSNAWFKQQSVCICQLSKEDDIQDAI